MSQEPIRKYLRGKRYTRKYLAGTNKEYWAHDRRYYARFALTLRLMERLGFNITQVYGSTHRVRLDLPTTDATPLWELAMLEVKLGVTFHEVRQNVRDMTVLIWYNMGARA